MATNILTIEFRKMTTIPWYNCIALSISMDTKHSIIKGLHCISPRLLLACRTNAGLDWNDGKADRSIARGIYLVDFVMY